MRPAPLLALAFTLAACGEAPDTSGFPDVLPDTADTRDTIDDTTVPVDTADTHEVVNDTTVPIDTRDTTPVDTIVPVDTHDTIDHDLVADTDEEVVNDTGPDVNDVHVDAEVTPVCEGACPRVLVGPSGIKLTTHPVTARPPLLAGLVNAFAIPAGGYDLVAIDIYQFGVFEDQRHLQVVDRGTVGGLHVLGRVLALDVTFAAVIQLYDGLTVISTVPTESRTRGGGCFELDGSMLIADMSYCPPMEPEDLANGWSFQYSEVGGLIIESRVVFRELGPRPIVIHHRFVAR